jgi:hypothetical protein
MSRNSNALWICLAVCTAIVLTGCGGPSGSMKMQFAPGDKDTYESTVQVIKDFRFEQPNLNKLREEQTKTEIVMGYDQAVEAVDADGSATVKITLNSIKVDIVNKNEQKFAFDSAKEESKSSPFAALLGQSYTIKLTPDGKATPVDMQAVRTAVKDGYEKRVADSLLDDKAIAERHGIAALPQEKVKTSVKTSWTETAASPPGLLVPKNYAKVYTIKDVEDRVALVEMTASESGAATEKASAGGMGMFAKMFDNEDIFTGGMKINIVTGEVLAAEETLISTYVAQETPENGDPAKGPDTLTMRFTNKNKLEKK